jgi:hypothetical protein
VFGQCLIKCDNGEQYSESDICNSVCDPAAVALENWLDSSCTRNCFRETYCNAIYRLNYMCKMICVMLFIYSCPKINKGRVVLK